mgnify:CR=1 FL=1
MTMRLSGCRKFLLMWYRKAEKERRSKAKSRRRSKAKSRWRSKAEKERRSKILRRVAWHNRSLRRRSNGTAVVKMTI